MLGHVGSRGAFVADQLLVGGTVQVEVLASREAHGVLLRGQLGLSVSGAKEHEQLKDRCKALVKAVRARSPLPNTFGTPGIPRGISQGWETAGGPAPQLGGMMERVLAAPPAP